MTGEELLTKNGIAMKKIARALMTYKVGDRIPRVQDFAGACGVGRGTVQGALQLLIDENAIRIESRGHLGTYLLDSDFVKLWELAGASALMGAMPLPYSRRNEGLATGLYGVFERKGVPFHLSYMRGSTNRVKALQGGRYDLVVVSTRAAELAVAEFDVSVLHSFGPHTYVGAHAMLFSSPKFHNIEPGMRVGIDLSSTDQKTLTLEVCQGIEVKYIDLPYMQILEQLVHGTIDVAIWNGDEVENRFGKNGPVYVRPLEVNEADATEATILVRQSDYDIFMNLKDELDLARITEIQKEVLEGKRVPRY